MEIREKMSQPATRDPGRGHHGTASGPAELPILESAIEAIFIVDPTSMAIRWANAAARDLLGYDREELLALTIPEIHPPDALPRILADFAARSVVGGLSRSIPVRRKDGSTLLVDIRASLMDVDGVPSMVGFFSDVTQARRLETHDRKLAEAIEQTSDSVVITDVEGTIEYANPAFERLSGWDRREVIGLNPRILKSGKQSDAFYRAFWRRLSRGRVWRGRMVNRRADGVVYEVQATISPLLGPEGEITGYVGVERDVTAMRAVKSALAAEFRERAQAAAALGRLQPGPTDAATAADIRDELLAIPGFDVATIFDFAGPATAVALAHGGPPGTPVATGEAIPAVRARYLYERAMLGPWAEGWQARPADGSYGAQMTAVGLKAAAYAPIRNGDGLLGLVAAGTSDPSFARHLIDHLPVVGEFAATASALLSHGLERAHRAEVARDRIRAILTERAFHPVFQPIVDLATNEPVGYEALTRFDVRTPPDQLIAEARALGLGVEVEMACLAAAVDAAEMLPSGPWLSLNLSPHALLNTTNLADVLAGTARDLVVELTEHVGIDDYRAVQRVVDGLGGTLRFAVDDTGSGFAGLRHLVELRPQFLKLDISLVRGVDDDRSRQAMIAGLIRFAQQADCEVIAEGIERESDLAMLRTLGVPYGQGYLLGRPEVAGPGPER